MFSARTIDSVINARCKICRRRGGIAVTGTSIAGHSWVNDFYYALCDKSEDVGVIGSWHTIDIVGTVNDNIVSNPDISRGDDGNFAFDDLIWVGQGSVAVSADYDVAIDIDLSADILVNVCICDIDSYVIAVIRVIIVISIDIIFLELCTATARNCFVIPGAIAA